jgi:diacylglycerol kinase (ATP)
MKNRPFLNRLEFALNGIGLAWVSERSFRTQTFFGIVAVLVLIVLRPGPIWSALIVIMIALVLAAELLNSALEALVDRLHPEIHPEIKKVKDMAAGAVLMLSIASLIVGLLMLISLTWD